MIIEVHGANSFWWYRLKSRNGNILVTSEGYTRKRDGNRAATKMAALMKCKVKLKLA